MNHNDHILYTELEKFCGGAGSGKPGPCPGDQKLYDRVQHINGVHNRTQVGLLGRMQKGEYAPEDVVSDSGTYHNQTAKASINAHKDVYQKFKKDVADKFGQHVVDSPEWGNVKEAFHNAMAQHLDDLKRSASRTQGRADLLLRYPQLEKSSTKPERDHIHELTNDSIKNHFAHTGKIWDAVQELAKKHGIKERFPTFSESNSKPNDRALYAELVKFCGGKGSKRPGPCPTAAHNVHIGHQAQLAGATARLDAAQAKHARHGTEATSKALTAAQDEHKAATARAEASMANARANGWNHTKSIPGPREPSSAKTAWTPRPAMKKPQTVRSDRSVSATKPVPPAPRNPRFKVSAGKPAPKLVTRPWDPKGKPDFNDVYTAPVSELHVDPQRFQYKLGVDKSGVTGHLKDTAVWNPHMSGILTVWKDPKDGKTYVVNGHHRAELAKRTGHPTVAVRYVNAPDAKAARAVGALVNIAEGSGTAVDAAKYMRDTGTTADDLVKSGVSLKGKVAPDAIALTRLNDSSFDKVARGLMDPNKALAVAKNLPDHDLQKQLFSLLDKRAEQGKETPLNLIESMAKEMADTPKTTTTTQSLFGNIESEDSLFVPRNELKTHIRNQLSQEVNDFLMAASKRRASRLGAAGNNSLDYEANAKIAQEANGVRAVFDTLVNRKGQISDAINKGAEEYVKATTRRARDRIKEATLNNVRDAVFREAGLEGKGGRPGGGQPDHPGQPGSTGATTHRELDQFSDRALYSALVRAGR